MLSVGERHGSRAVWRRDRRGTVVPEASRLSVRRGGTLGQNERQQHRAVVGRAAVAPQPFTLLLTQLPELEVGPELTEAAVARIAEQSGPKLGAALIASPGQAQPLDQLAQHLRI